MSFGPGGSLRLGCVPSGPHRASAAPVWSYRKREADYLRASLAVFALHRPHVIPKMLRKAVNHSFIRRMISPVE